MRYAMWSTRAMRDGEREREKRKRSGSIFDTSWETVHRAMLPRKCYAKSSPFLSSFLWFSIMCTAYSLQVCAYSQFNLNGSNVCRDNYIHSFVLVLVHWLNLSTRGALEPVWIWKVACTNNETYMIMIIKGFLSLDFEYPSRVLYSHNIFF